MLINILGTKVSIIPSIHRLTHGFQLDKAIVDRVVQADLVLFERDLDQPISLPARTSLQLGAAPPAQIPGNLQTLWSGQAVGRNVAELQSLTVAEIAETLDAGIDLNTFGIFYADGVDMQLWSRVAPDKRDWLQSMADLLSALAPYPDSEQLADLAYACDIAQRRRDFLDELDAWRIKDISRLGNLLDVIYQRTPVRAQEVLLRRNQVMLQAIAKSFADTERTTVFVLGAAHVVGAYGLLQDLTKVGRQYHVV